MSDDKPLSLTPASDFAVSWLQKHLAKHEGEAEDLTWYVGLGVLYSDYTKAAYRTPHGVLPYQPWIKLLTFLYPGGRVHRRGTKELFTGVRYFREEGVLIYGA